MTQKHVHAHLKNRAKVLALCTFLDQLNLKLMKRPIKFLGACAYKTRGSAEFSRLATSTAISSGILGRDNYLTIESNLKMATAVSSTSQPEIYKYWGDIPEEVRDMMLCHACNLQPFDKDNAIVLPCAHVMCLDCVSDRVSKTSAKDKVECPKCAAIWNIPLGTILAFPRDFFSLVLYNTLLGKSHGMVRPNPKCAIHPKEDVSKYC